jgi:hypothetical protein
MELSTTLKLNALALLSFVMFPHVASAQQLGLRSDTAAYNLSAVLLPSTGWSPYGRVDQAPASGMVQLVMGWGLVGVGLLNLALLPVCYADFYPKDGKELCVGASIGIAAAGVAVGIPLLLWGYNKRAAYKDWKARRGLSYHLSNLGLAAGSGGGSLVYRAAW